MSNRFMNKKRASRHSRQDCDAIWMATRPCGVCEDSGHSMVIEDIVSHLQILTSICQEPDGQTAKFGIAMRELCSAAATRT